jgi:16S rRNA (uracil1498-N3)-methyltransferase
MPPPRLFCPNIAEKCITLSAEESHHAISVLRLKAGETVSIFDGAGRRATGNVQNAHRRRLTVLVTEVEVLPFDLSLQLTLAVAMPRAARQGYLVEKCTELGVAAIWPVTSDRSVAAPKAGALEKWKRRGVEAAKQSRRAWVPAIRPTQTFDESIQLLAGFDLACIADADCPSKGMLDVIDGLPEGGSLIVFVGPEGGWSPDERRAAVEAGAVPVSLGPTVLRTETAAVAACAAVAMRSAPRNTSNAVG